MEQLIHYFLKYEPENVKRAEASYKTNGINNIQQQWTGFSDSSDSSKSRLCIFLVAEQAL